MDLTTSGGHVEPGHTMMSWQLWGKTQKHPKPQYQGGPGTEARWHMARLCLLTGGKLVPAAVAEIGSKAKRT